jgi:hypothetical protein
LKLKGDEMVEMSLEIWYWTGEKSMAFDLEYSPARKNRMMRTTAAQRGSPWES